MTAIEPGMPQTRKLTLTWTFGAGELLNSR